MLIAFSFRAKAGMESEFERLLNDPAAGRFSAQKMGATRNTLFLREGTMIRVLEFPDSAKPRSLAEIAEEDPRVKDFLRAIGPLIEDGFDPDDPESLQAFNRRVTFPLTYDVRL